MSSRRAASSTDAEPTTLDQQEEAFVGAYVESALAQWQGKLSENDLGWMRERLIASVRENPELARLARAAVPRDVDQSGEVMRPAVRAQGGGAPRVGAPGRKPS